MESVNLCKLMAHCPITDFKGKLWVKWYSLSVSVSSKPSFNITSFNNKNNILDKLNCGEESLSPCYFLMKSTWIHSIELHSEKQLVWRLQSCKQLWRGVSGESDKYNIKDTSR